MQAGDTRTAVLSHIVENGGATVADLVAALALSDATVRRHLDKLELDALIGSRPVRQETGRPYYVYSATDAGVRRERDHSADLAVRILAQVKAGTAGTAAMAEGMAEQVAASYRAQIHADQPLEERVVRAVEALHREGILDGWARTEDGIELHNHACPYRSAADASDCVCESDRRAIEKLLGVSVEQVANLIQGDDACAYRIPARAAGDRRDAAPAPPTPAARRRPAKTR